MAGGTVAATFVSGLLDFAGVRGADRGALATSARLSPHDFADADQRVPLEKYILLMRKAKTACADPAFALHFGEAADIREMSIAALLGHSGTTAMGAFEAANKYGRLDLDTETEGGVRFQLTQKAGRLWLADMRIEGAACSELTESSFARMVSAARRAGFDGVIRQVHVTHPQPVYYAEYQRVFGVPVTFSSDWNALQIDPAVLLQSVDTQPVYVTRMLTERADALLEELDKNKPIQRKVEAALRPQLANGQVRIADVALRLGISRQTLYRQLRAEGVTYEQILDNLRHRIAADALSDRRKSISEIAYSLGFADHSSFSKAFKRWTGMSPGQVRHVGSRQE